MRNAQSAQRRGFDRVLAIFSASAVFMSLMVMLAPAALAHHPEISAGQICDDGKVAITYDSISWKTDGSPGSGHSNIVIEVRVGGSGSWAQVGNGSYNAGNNYRFSGEFDGQPYANMSIEVRARAVGSWDNGLGGGETRTTGAFVVNLVCTQNVTVTAHSQVCVVNQGVPQGSVSFNIDPATGATVQVYANSNFTGPVGGELADDEVLNLAPGTYYWQAAAGQGFALTGNTSGEIVIDPCEASVNVSTGVCVVGANGPVGTVEVVIDPSSGATVVVSGPGGPHDFSGSGGTKSLAPGSYTWTATPGAGFNFPVGQETSGQFEIAPCDATVVDASVVVSHGNCIPGAANALGSVNVAIAPATGAIVTVFDIGGQKAADFDGSGGQLPLKPGAYTWIASATPGFSLVGVTSGGFTVQVCDEVLGEVIENDDPDAEISEDDEVLELVVLPFTGASTDLLLGAAIALLGSGLVLIRSARRRDQR